MLDSKTEIVLGASKTFFIEIYTPVKTTGSYIVEVCKTFMFMRCHTIEAL